MTGTREKSIRTEDREWVEEILDRLNMVEWDRFVVGDDPNIGAYIEVYGWIERDQDDYKDFVLVTFYPETEDRILGFTTSSDRYTEEIHRRIFGEDPDGHNPCRRVEHVFDVENAIELGKQATLPDGGR